MAGEEGAAGTGDAGGSTDDVSVSSSESLGSTKPMVHGLQT